MSHPEFVQYEFFVEFCVSTTEKDQLDMLKKLEEHLKDGIDEFCKQMNMSRSAVSSQVVKGLL